jgi:hypothetical protein
MQRSSQLSLKEDLLPRLSACGAEGEFLKLTGQLLQLGAADRARALTLSAERQKPGDLNNSNRTRQDPVCRKSAGPCRDFD